MRARTRTQQKHTRWCSSIFGVIRKKKEGVWGALARSFMHESPSVWNAFMHIIYSCSLIYPYVVKVGPYQQFRKFWKNFGNGQSHYVPKVASATVTQHFDTSKKFPHAWNRRAGGKELREDCCDCITALTDLSKLIYWGFKASTQQHFLLLANRTDVYSFHKGRPVASHLLRVS